MNFKPTHELTTENGETIKIMMVGNYAYQGHEWAESMISEITYDGSWKINGEPFNVTAKPPQPEDPDDFR